MVQSDSLSLAVPIENSPPGIHTIPGGATSSAGDVLAAVDEKADDVEDAGGSGEREGFIARTVKTAAVRNPSVRIQPTCEPLFGFFFCFMVSSDRRHCVQRCRRRLQPARRPARPLHSEYNPLPQK